ncbi:Rv3235 family protein [Actinokineospora enzanensis]|uniref:Rv3235 family protein n=1 Tax=Actinokineospora enzanensis TaxID=155975 RepID=UPI000374EC58|nr:Rv3235 family protein [Actinokineospora enzanensis]
MRIEALPEYEPPLAEADEERWSTPPSRPPTWTVHGPARDIAWRLMTLCLEALSGERTLPQLHGVLSGPVWEAMLTRTRAPTRGRFRLVTMRLCQVRADIVEFAATTRFMPAHMPGRWVARAFAGRLEEREGRWLCTYLRPVGF